MLSDFKTSSICFISIGLGLEILAAVIHPSVASYRLVPILAITGTSLLIHGCCDYAEGKGWHRAWGWLGLLSLPGLLILICLKDYFGGDKAV